MNTHVFLRTLPPFVLAAIAITTPFSASADPASSDVQVHGTPSSKTHLIGTSAEYSGRYRVLVHPQLLTELELSIGDWVRVRKTNEYGNPEPALTAKMYEIIDSHSYWSSSWDPELRPIRLGPEGRERLQGSTSPYDFFAEIEVEARPEYAVELWGSHTATEDELVGDANRKHIAVPPMALASLGIEVGDTVRVWRDGNSNGVEDDSGSSCDTLDTPPCEALYEAVLAYESEVSQEQPVRMGRDGRDRLGLVNGNEVIVSTTDPLVPDGPFHMRIDTGPLAYYEQTVLAEHAYRNVVLPSPTIERLGLELGDDVRVTRDNDLDGFADPGEPFLIYTLVGDYDLPPSEAKYNRVRMGAQARSLIGAEAGDAVIVEPALFTYDEQMQLALASAYEDSSPSTGGLQWAWGGYGEASDPPTNPPPSDNSTLTHESPLTEWVERTGDIADWEAKLNFSLLDATKHDEHIALPADVARELGVLPGQQIRVWVRLPGVDDLDAQVSVSELSCDANELAELPYMLMTVTNVVDEDDLPNAVIGEDTIERLREHLDAYRALSNNAALLGLNVQLVLDKRIVCSSAPAGSSSSLYGAAKPNGQPFEEYAFPTGTPGFIALAPHGGNIETGTHVQARNLYDYWQAMGYSNPAYWAFRGHYGGPGMESGSDISLLANPDTWKSSHITGHDIDDTPERCLPNGPDVGTMACTGHGQPWSVSYPKLGEVNHVTYPYALAFHGFGAGGPKINKTSSNQSGELWCPRDRNSLKQPTSSDIEKACVFIGGLAPRLDRQCFLKKLKDEFSSQLGINFTAVQDGSGKTIEFKGFNASNTREYKFRIASRTETLAGRYLKNIVNRLTRYYGTPYQDVETGLWRADYYNSVQYEESKTARDSTLGLRGIIHSATAKATDIIRAGTQSSECAL